MEEVKITSVEKVEHVKDPKRVEAGKRLAAMSKQAKDKKASERLTQKTFIDEFQIPEVDPSTSIALVGVAGFVGAVVYYKYFYKDVRLEVETPESKTLDRSKEKPTPKRSEPTEGRHKRRELDTLD